MEIAGLSAMTDDLHRLFTCSSYRLKIHPGPLVVIMGQWASPVEEKSMDAADLTTSPRACTSARTLVACTGLQPRLSMPTKPSGTGPGKRSRPTNRLGFKSPSAAREPDECILDSLRKNPF